MKEKTNNTAESLAELDDYTDAAQSLRTSLVGRLKWGSYCRARASEAVQEMVEELEEAADMIDTLVEREKTMHTEQGWNNLELIDQHGELLLECEIGGEYHQSLLEVGMNTVLKRFIQECELADGFVEDDDVVLSKIISWQKMTSDEMRLKAGELTPQEVLIIRAVLNDINPPTTDPPATSTA